MNICVLALNLFILFKSVSFPVFWQSDTDVAATYAARYISQQVTFIGESKRAG